MIGAAYPGRNDNGQPMPAWQQVEHATAILRRFHDRPPTDTEIRWARRCLMAALAALEGTAL